MSEQPRPIERRLEASVMRIVNVPMRIVLGIPVATPLGKRLGGSVGHRLVLCAAAAMDPAVTCPGPTGHTCSQCTIDR